MLGCYVVAALLASFGFQPYTVLAMDEGEQQARTLHIGTAQAVLVQADELYTHGEYSEVIALLEPIIDKYPDLLALPILLGDAYMRHCDYVKAILAYRQAAKLEHAQGYNKLSHTWSMSLQQRLDESYVALRQRNGVASLFPLHLADLAEQYSQHGFAMVLDFAEVEPASVPEDEEVLCYAFGFTGRSKNGYRFEIPKADQHLLTAMSLLSTSRSELKPELLFLAASEAEAALECRPDWPEAQYVLGAVYAESGQLREAITAYQAYLQLTPDDQYHNHEIINAVLSGLVKQRRVKLLEQLNYLSVQHRVHSKALHDQFRLYYNYPQLRQRTW